MNGAPDLPTTALIAAFLLLTIPIAFSRYFQLGIVRETLVASIRMGLQLLFAGLYLTWLFRFDHPVLNLLWLLIMMAVASVTIAQKSTLKLREIFGPVALATLIATLAVVWYFNTWIVRLDRWIEAKYLVVIGGMLLGNSLTGNIIGLTHFFQSLKKDEERYLYWLGNGATRNEALRPFLREAMVRSIRPTLASMATMGIVSLPGMMTGQMLGGSAPIVAIHYQIAIMLAIYVSVTLGVALAILLSCRKAFDDYGVLRKEIFAE
jgi:putative ABC transport system permease protein